MVKNSLNHKMTSTTGQANRTSNNYISQGGSSLSHDWHQCWHQPEGSVSDGWSEATLLQTWAGALDQPLWLSCGGRGAGSSGLL
jgi:hypothetical protein